MYKKFIQFTSAYSFVYEPWAGNYCKWEPNFHTCANQPYSPTTARLTQNPRDKSKCPGGYSRGDFASHKEAGGLSSWAEHAYVQTFTQGTREMEFATWFSSRTKWYSSTKLASIYTSKEWEEKLLWDYVLYEKNQQEARSQFYHAAGGQLPISITATSKAAWLVLDLWEKSTPSQLLQEMIVQSSSSSTMHPCTSLCWERQISVCHLIKKCSIIPYHFVASSVFTHAFMLSVPLKQP